MGEVWLPTCGAGAELYYNDPITNSWQPVCGAQNTVYGNVNGEWVPLCCQVGGGGGVEPDPYICAPRLLPMNFADPLIAGGYFPNRIQWSNGDNAVAPWPYYWLPTDTWGWAPLDSLAMHDNWDGTYAHAVVTGSVAPPEAWGGAHFFSGSVWASFGPLSPGWHNLAISFRVRITPHEGQDRYASTGHALLRYSMLDAGTDPYNDISNMDSYLNAGWPNNNIGYSQIEIPADGSWFTVNTSTPWSTTTAHGNNFRMMFEVPFADVLDVSELTVYETFTGPCPVEGWTDWITPDVVDLRPSVLSQYNDTLLPTSARASVASALDWATSISRAMNGDYSYVDTSGGLGNYTENVTPGRWQFTEFDYSANGIYGGNNAYAYSLDALTYETRPNIGGYTANSVYPDGGYTEYIRTRTGAKSIVDIYWTITQLMQAQLLGSYVPSGYHVAEWQYENPVVIPAHPTPTEISGSLWNQPNTVCGFRVETAYMALFAYTVSTNPADSITSPFSFSYRLYNPHSYSDTSFEHKHGSVIGTMSMSPTSPAFQQQTVNVLSAVREWFPDYASPAGFGTTASWEVGWHLAQPFPVITGDPGTTTVWKARAEVSGLGLVARPGRVRLRIEKDA